MKKKILLFLLICHSSLFAQNQKVTAYVLDELKKPLSDVHIYTNTQKFTLTNFEGKFELVLDSTDTLYISHIGFETLFFLANQIPFKIILKNKDFVLPELEINAKKQRKSNKNLGTFWDKKSNFFLGGKQFAQFISNSYSQEGLINKGYIKIDQSTSALKHLTMKIQIQLYEGNQSPDQELLTESLVVNFPLGTSKLTIDLSPYHLVFPKKGLFLGVKVLGYFDKDNKWVEVDRIQNNLLFSCAFSEEKTLSFQKNGNKWSKLGTHDEQMVNLMFGLSVDFFE